MDGQYEGRPVDDIVRNLAVKYEGTFGRKFDPGLLATHGSDLMDIALAHTVTDALNVMSVTDSLNGVLQLEGDQGLVGDTEYPSDSLVIPMVYRSGETKTYHVSEADVDSAIPNSETLVGLAQNLYEVIFARHRNEFLPQGPVISAERTRTKRNWALRQGARLRRVGLR